MGAQLVWFKRDLRVHDNAALASAAALGPVLCVYIVEPSYWRCPDASQRQFDFLRECLRDLYRQLQALGVRLHVLTGEVPEVLERLHPQLGFSHLHSHQETGNGMTYQRDQAVARWCTARGVHWQEQVQNGVVRRLPSRDLWSALWTQRMQAPQVLPPARPPPPGPGQKKAGPTGKPGNCLQTPQRKGKSAAGPKPAGPCTASCTGAAPSTGAASPRP